MSATTKILAREDTATQLAIITEARKMGLDPTSLTMAQYRFLSVRVRSFTQLMKDGGKAIASRVRTGMGFTVSLPIAQQNENTCRQNTCGAFRTLEGGEAACDLCNCAGKFLKSKWLDPGGTCPKNLWSNPRYLQSLAKDQLEELVLTNQVKSKDGDCHA